MAPWYAGSARRRDDLRQSAGCATCVIPKIWDKSVGNCWTTPACWAANLRFLQLPMMAALPDRACGQIHAVFRPAVAPHPILGTGRRPPGARSDRDGAKGSYTVCRIARPADAAGGRAHPARDRRAGAQVAQTPRPARGGRHPVRDTRGRHIALTAAPGGGAQSSPLLRAEPASALCGTVPGCVAPVAGIGDVALIPFAGPCHLSGQRSSSGDPL